MSECSCYCHRTYDDCGTDCCKQAKESERRDREMSAKCYEEDRIKEEQNSKLRELIEKYYNHPNSNISSFCKELLKESKIG